MEVQQIYTLMNDVSREILGETAVVSEHLDNVVDIGRQIFTATSVDNYVKSLVDHIGRVIFVNRPYAGAAPSVLMDGWEFGSVMEKIQIDLPTASENRDWTLTSGTSYDPNVFYQPVVSAKFFNSKVTFEVDVSFTEKQVKESFDNADQLNAFISMIYSAVDKSMTIKVDALIMRTINNYTAELLHHEIPDNTYSASSTVRAVNLLKLYNTKFSANLTPATAITNPDFIRFATLQIGMYVDRITKMSELFNIGGKARFTPKDMLHLIMLSEFEKASAVYLQSDTFHNQLVELPDHETVPFWQGSGVGYNFDSTSSIHVTILDPTDNSTTVEIVAGGILAVMFDRDALGVSNYDRRVTTNYNAKAEFFNNFYKMDAKYFNDFNENFVVFFVA